MKSDAQKGKSAMAETRMESSDNFKGSTADPRFISAYDMCAELYIEQYINKLKEVKEMTTNDDIKDLVAVNGTKLTKLHDIFKNEIDTKLGIIYTAFEKFIMEFKELRVDIAEVVALINSTPVEWNRPTNEQLGIPPSKPSGQAVSFKTVNTAPVQGIITKIADFISTKGKKCEKWQNAAGKVAVTTVAMKAKVIDGALTVTNPWHIEKGFTNITWKEDTPFGGS